MVWIVMMPEIVDVDDSNSDLVRIAIGFTLASFFLSSFNLSFYIYNISYIEKSFARMNEWATNEITCDSSFFFLLFFLNKCDCSMYGIATDMKKAKAKLLALR